MFTKALVATDLSSASFTVVNCLAGLRALGTRECVLCYCFDLPNIKAFPELMRDWFEQQLTDQKKALEGHGFTVTVRAVPGLPQIEIPRMAAKEDCSLLVVGSHGHNLMSEIFLGEVASTVIQYAPVPVLVLRLAKGEGGDPVCVPGHCNFLDQILYATDFSDHAEYAFSHVEGLVASGARKVTVLHVQDRTKIDPHLKERLEEFNQIDRERLARMQARLAEIGATDVDIQICTGIPKAEILGQARQRQATLVVMGTHGRGFVEEIFLGSVSHTVARHAEAPVLLVPMSRKDDKSNRQ